MALSKDPIKRAAQLANLAPDAPVKSGAYSETKIAPLRERFFTEASEAYPGELEDDLWLFAQRKAMVHQFAAFHDARGLIRHQRRGEPFPSAMAMAKVMDSLERQLERFERRKSERTQPASIIAEWQRQLPGGGS